MTDLAKVKTKGDQYVASKIIAENVSVLKVLRSPADMKAVLERMRLLWPGCHCWDTPGSYWDAIKHDLWRHGVQPDDRPLFIQNRDDPDHEKSHTVGFKDPVAASRFVAAAAQVGAQQDHRVDIYGRVKKMHEQFGFPVGDSPKLLDKELFGSRVVMMQEELGEFIEAILTDDLEEAADALVDLTVFVFGTAVMMGLPFNELFIDVMRANVTKRRQPTARGEFDLIKPDGWVGPRTGEILRWYQQDTA